MPKRCRADSYSRSTFKDQIVLAREGVTFFLAERPGEALLDHDLQTYTKISHFVKQMIKITQRNHQQMTQLSYKTNINSVIFSKTTPRTVCVVLFIDDLFQGLNFLIQCFLIMCRGCTRSDPSHSLILVFQRW